MKLDPIIATLAEYRALLGLSVHVVARRAAISPQVIAHAEAGNRSPQLLNVRRWANALGMDLWCWPGDGQVHPGAYALDNDGFMWVLWTFDARPGADVYWWRLAPALVLGFQERMVRERGDVPGRILHPGDPNWTLNRSIR